MERNLKVKITDKIAVLMNGEDGKRPFIVCDNTDYTITFLFDDEWDLAGAKTARFTYRCNGEDMEQNIPFTGDTVEVPALSHTLKVEVGVFAGNLKTSTSAEIGCLPSALSKGGKVPDPEPDVYNEIMEMINGLIFHGENHYVTSPFGRRSTISTAAGNTSSYHYGTDYGTNGKKIAQYAIEDGEIISCGRASDGALFVWVKYPRLGVKMLHYHLNSYKVKVGQKVNKNTVIGYTGKTGKATGIHLHLGIKKLSGGSWIDPEAWSKTYKPPTSTSSTYFTKYTGNSTSIVNALAAIGAQTSYSYRAKIAAANGVKNYVGSAAQNSLMLSMLKSGKLIKP